MPSIINATTTAGVTVTGDNSGALALQTNNGTTAVTIDTSQRVAFVAGTDALPAITTTGDTNTGIFFPAADTIAFTEGGTERMRIDSSGNLLVGATGQISSEKLGVTQSANSQAVAISATNASYTADAFIVYASRNTTNNSFYALNYFNTGASAYKFRVADSGNVTNTNGSYGTISDQKLKENIVDATPKLDKVNQLKVRNFNLIGDELKQIGFVAQEFEQVFSSMVEESQDRTPDGELLGTTTKTIKTTVLIPILVKAIQELNAKVEAQAVRIAELEGAK